MTNSTTSYPEPGPDLERFWQTHVLHGRGSGQSQVEYCCGQGLSVHRLRWWKAKLERRTSSAEGPALIPVQVQARLPEEPGRARGESGVRVWLGQGRCVEVAVGFDRATLGGVIQVVGP